MKHRRLLASVVLGVLFLAGPLPGDTESRGVPADRKAFDTTLYQTLKEVINRGAVLYNSGEMSACHRVYEGALITIRPMIDHHPDLQQAITKGLAAAEADPVVWRRAFTLRAVLDKLRKELTPVPGKIEKLNPPRIEDEPKLLPKKDEVPPPPTTPPAEKKSTKKDEETPPPEKKGDAKPPVKQDPPPPGGIKPLERTKDEPRKDEPKKDEPKKDLPKKDEVKKDEVKKDELKEDDKNESQAPPR